MARLERIDRDAIAEHLRRTSLDQVSPELVGRGYTLGINDAACRLSGEPIADASPVAGGGDSLPEPRSAHLSKGVVESLRLHIYSKSDADQVAEWLETLLRFCEINKWNLQKRFAREWGSDTGTTLFINIAALFADYYLASGDLRYMNILLKMMRKSFVTDLDKLLPAHSSDTASALSLCRLKIWAVAAGFIAGLDVSENR